MRIDPAGWPFILGGVVLALIVGVAAGKLFGAVLLLLPLFFLFFFRDPHRVIDAPPSTVVSPADGRVMVAVEPPAPGAGGSAGRWPRDGGRRADGAGFSGGGLASDQHLPVTDGRARQPDAGW